MRTAMKYAKIKLIDDIFLLKPMGFVTGEVEDGYFKTGNQVFCHVSNPILDGKYVVGNDMTDEELLEYYGMENKDDLELVKSCYFDDKMEEMIIIRDGKQITFKPGELYDDNESEKSVYDVIDGEDSVVLNEKILNIILNMDDMDSMKELLTSYRDSIVKYTHSRTKEGVQRVYMKDGVPADIEFDPVKYKKAKANETEKEEAKNYEKPSSSNVPRAFEELTLDGLEKYLKERIFGHDEEIEMIATVLMSNFTASVEDGVESFLIPGPTGTGKTATMECAAEYLGVPIVVANTINLVPQGYVGTTVEDVLYSLISANGFREELYNRAIIVFDEFDKLGKDSLDEKVTLTNIFLKLIEGGDFPISKEYKTYKVNTRMLNKVFLGAFTEAFANNKERHMGFATDTKQEKKEARFSEQRLIDAGYFDRELLTRINYYFPYYELDDDTKLHVILNSKLSTFLKKKQRFEREYGVTITGDEEFARGVIEALKKGDKSVRDLNNLISNALLKPQREIMRNKGSYKQLRLTGDTVLNKTFELL